MAVLLLCDVVSMQAAITYRMTITTTSRPPRPPSIQQIITDGEKRRLTIENAEAPFIYDVLLSPDGGRTITALNTPLKTWFDKEAFDAKHPHYTGLPPGIKTQIKDAKISISEEPTDEPVEGFPVRKFVVRASYNTQEDFNGTIVKRVHAITTLLWTTDKLDRSLAFGMPPLDTGVASLDTELRQKAAAFGFPLRRVTTVSRAYEGGEPVVEITRIEIGKIETVASPPASVFARPSAYANQAPVIGAFGKM